MHSFIFKFKFVFWKQLRYSLWLTEIRFAEIILCLASHYLFLLLLNKHSVFLSVMCAARGFSRLTSVLLSPSRALLTSRLKAISSRIPWISWVWRNPSPTAAEIKAQVHRRNLEMGKQRATRLDTIQASAGPTTSSRARCQAKSPRKATLSTGSRWRLIF